MDSQNPKGVGGEGASGGVACLYCGYRGHATWECGELNVCEEAIDPDTREAYQRELRNDWIHAATFTEMETTVCCNCGSRVTGVVSRVGDLPTGDRRVYVRDCECCR